MSAIYKNRPKKRLALQSIFSNALKYFDKEFVYITLSSSEIMDVDNLLEFVEEDRIKKIIAYEKDEERSLKAKNSQVAQKFEGKIKIINGTYPESLGEELEEFSNIQKIVFFDGEEWFCNKTTSNTRSDFEDLLKKRVLGHNDIYLITSCMARLAWHAIEKEQFDYFNYYYFKNDSNYNNRTSEELKELLINNVVDLNVEVAIRNCNSLNEKIGIKGFITAERLGKTKYNDYGHTHMSLLGFRFLKSTVIPKPLKIPFDYEYEYISNKIIESGWDMIRKKKNF